MAARRPRRRPLLAALLLALALGLTACGPEADRGRGGGAGADIGNRAETVQMHGEKGRNQRIFYRTPRMAPVEG